jgi:hypothetical protein
MTRYLRKGQYPEGGNSKNIDSQPGRLYYMDLRVRRDSRVRRDIKYIYCDVH